jgi:hypothetical protein
MSNLLSHYPAQRGNGRRALCLVASVILVWLGSVILGGPALGQTTQGSSATREPEALNVVHAAIAALGGQTALSAIQDATISGNCISVDTDNPAVGNRQTAVNWTVSGREFRYLSRNEGEDHVLVSGHGKPKVSEKAVTKGINPLTQVALKPYHLPGVVLVRELEDGTRSFKSIGTENISGTQAIHIRIFTTVGGWPVPALDQNWYFDPSSHLPVAVTYRLPTGSSSVFVTAKMIYQTFETSQGMPTIQRVRTEYDGLDPKACTLNPPTINSHPPAVTFDLSE